MPTKLEVELWEVTQELNEEFYALNYEDREDLITRVRKAINGG